MSKSECICKRWSCESVLDHIGTGHLKEDYRISTERRFRFEKDETGCIFDGGVVPNDIPTCRKEFNEYRKEDGGSGNQNGHRERSIANDNRKNGHKKHK
jgi:hypothetical protein